MSGHRQTIAAAIAVVLASTALYALFIGVTWFWAGVGATLTVAIVGTLTRLRRLPVMACLAASAAGLVLYLNIAFEAGQSLGHVLPTGSSLSHLLSLVSQGMTEAGKYAPPAPELPGMMLLATGGIGIVAVFTDLIAVRLRSAALAGIPLLLLVTEPFAVSASRSWVGTLIPFCLGAAGYLAMLATESRERIREWEQPRSGPGDGPDTTALSAAGRRVGIASVVVALIVPLLVPGLHTTRLLGGGPGIGGHPGSGGGGSAAAGFPSPETVMSDELHQSAAVPVLRYRSAGPNGQSEPEYLQVAVLDELTADGWKVVSTSSQAVDGPGNRPLPAPPGLENTADSQSVQTAVQVSNGVNGKVVLGGETVFVLPVPYPALAVTVRGTWRASTTDLTVYSSDTDVDGLSYQVESLDLTPTTQDLENAGPPDSAWRAYLSVPPSYAGLRPLAEQVATGKTTAFDKAIALQSWLDGNGGFRYTLHASTVANARQLAAFLNSTKSGYCQQFAVAMAVLARLLGIPSRVVVGFTSGTRQSDGNWLVTTHDAHEWPELYVTGFGWLRFEPTPTGTDGQGTATVPEYASPPSSIISGSGPGATSPIPSASGSARPGSGRILPPGLLQPIGLGVGLNTKKGADLTPWEITGLVLAGLLVLGVLSPSAARLVIRRRRWRRAARGGDAQLAHTAWQELQDDLIDYQAGYSASESPRALKARVCALVKDAADPDDGSSGGTPARELAAAPAGAAARQEGGEIREGAAFRPGTSFWGEPEVLPGRARDVVDMGLADQASGELTRVSVARAGIAALERITMAEERARYAAGPLPGGHLQRDSAAVRRALAMTRPRRDRWRARMLPQSVLTPTATGVSQAADVFGRVSLPQRATPRRGRERPGSD
jgi:transglutaminase-like putative cysteine protease